MLAVVESCGAKTWLFSGQRDQIAKAFDGGDCRFDRFAEQAALVAVALDDFRPSLRPVLYAAWKTLSASNASCFCITGNSSAPSLPPIELLAVPLRPPLATGESCPIPGESLGPIIPMPRGSRTFCMLMRSLISPDFLSVRYSTVRKHVHLSPIFASFVQFNTPGVVVALFFQCMNVLLNPANPTAWGTKWGLVAHTIVTFSFVTIYSAMYLDVQSLSYIDNREFPGNDVIPPGPIGYQFHILQEGISIVPTAVTIMNNWLADGLLVCPVFTMGWSYLT